MQVLSKETRSSSVLLGVQPLVVFQAERGAQEKKASLVQVPAQLHTSQGILCRAGRGIQKANYDLL